MVEWEKYGTVIMAFLIGGGFAIGGIASYSGIVNTGSSNQNQDTNLQLPKSLYGEEPFNRSVRELRVISYRNNVVFAVGYYKEDKSALKSDLENIQGIFEDKMYVRLVNASSSGLMIPRSQVQDFPAVLLIGGDRRRGSMIVRNVTRANVGSGVCTVIRNPQPFAAYCYS